MPYTLNGQPATIAEEPHEQQGTLYVPFAAVTEALGGSVTWDNDTKTATGTIGQWAATFTEASTTADVSGTQVSFSAPSYVNAGTLYVPPDFYHAAYGYTVTVNGADVSIAV